ncbi:hypothetical protein IJI18_00580, partial [Candidatus Saccharibacteria bacterium]|nr:hypothetical protein [Candidatus Saccharibacteria bacterium]
KSQTSGYYKMQDMTTNICAAVTQDQKIQLMDARQETSTVTYRTYWIAKLRDDKCWMIQNLRLGASLAASSGSMTLTTSNSNITNNFELTNKQSHPVHFPSKNLGKVDPAVSDSIFVWDGPAFYCAPSDGNNYVGCYYNWYTATAGIGKGGYGPNGATTPTTVEGNISVDICPKGWMMPSDGDNSDFQALSNQYTPLQMLVTNPTITYDNDGTYLPGFLLGGYYTGTADDGMGVSNSGWYWSRTNYSMGYAYRFIITTTKVSYNTKYNKDTGNSIRCLAYSS